MSFDTSRFTFRPRKNFLGVVMQQGRVQLDSDWNEWQSEYNRRIQAGTVDTFGQAVYPATTPNAFAISASNDSSGNHISIGAGRYYVDGLLAENHGPKSQEQWDTALAELSGAPLDSTSSATTDYTQQPYLPNATAPTTNGPFLAYLDVWEREVTYLEDPHLIDSAVGVDTTGRLQTVWQVKLMDVSSISGGVTCATDIPAFDALQAAPAGQLTTGVAPFNTSGPCCLTPNTGFTGLENQFYRVEIHNGGTSAAPPTGGFTYPLPTGTPTFKWSRDNASVATSVSAISSVTVSGNPVSQITVASLGRDQVLSFAVNDWIEITDDAHELNGIPGETYQITGVTAATMTLTLNGAISSAFPLTGGQTNPKLHTRILRWDQGGQISSTDSSGNLTPWINLGAPGSTGVIPVPPSGTTLMLEDGVTVAFGLSPSTGSFNTGDYWNFDARTADGTVETLTNAPPNGIHHHYAKLSIVTFPTTATNCRVEWPPSSTGCACGCTVTVSPSTITGNTTLQSIFDKYQNQNTTTTICLEPGTYSLPAPLRLTSTYNNFTLEACQPGTVTIQALSGNESNFTDGLIVLDNVDSITISGIEFIPPQTAFSATSFAGVSVSSLDPDVASIIQNLLVSICVRMVSATEVTIENCLFQLGRRFFYQDQAVEDKAASVRVEDKAVDIGNVGKVGNVGVGSVGVGVGSVGVGVGSTGVGIGTAGGGTGTSTSQNTISFAAGILASGENEGFSLQSSQFVGYADFLAGFLLAPAVSFAAPTTIFVAPTAPTGVVVEAEGQEAVAKGALGAKPTGAKAAAPAATPKAAKTAAPRLQETLLNKSASTFTDTNLTLASGTLKNILNFGNSVTNLASAGGSILAASLDDAVFNNNTFRGMTAAVLILGESGNVEFLANQVINCVAGFWLVTLTQAKYLLEEASSVTLVGASVAMGYPLPTGDTSTQTTVSAAPSSTRVYAGKSNYTDSNQNVWTPDVNDSSLTISTGSTTATPSPLPTITNTSDPTLYQTERYGNFSYTFNNLVAGYYTVILMFAELFDGGAGVRVFDVSINGQQVLTDFDIFKDSGGKDIADNQTFANIVPSSAGQIVIQFTGTSIGSDGNAKIDAVEIDPQWSGNPTLGSNEAEVPNFFDQLSQLAQQAYVNLDLSTLQLRIADNEMHNLGNCAVLILDDDSVYNENSGSLMMTGNRMDNLPLLQPFVAENQAANLNAARTSASLLNADIDVTTGSKGLFLVGILQVSRCVISANMFTTGTPGNGYGVSLDLDDVPVQQAELAIMSNVFTGRVAILPERGLQFPNVPAYLLSWDFLNTIIT